MILEFSVENFRSIRNIQTLSFVPDASSYLSESLLWYDVRPDIKLLPLILAYGANASGKTNLCKALEALRWVAVYSERELTHGEPIRIIQPYRLDKETREAPTRFCVRLLIGDELWEYRLSCNQTKILGESLRCKAHTPKSRWAIVFDRSGEDPKKWIGNAPRLNQGFFESVRGNATILSSAARVNIESVLGVFTQLYGMEVYTGSASGADIAKDALKNTVQTDALTDFLPRLVACADIEYDFIRLYPDGARLADTFSDEDLRFYRRGADGELVAFELSDVSSGTRHFVALVIRIFNAICFGTLLVMDEFDASLHPLLVNEVRNLLQDSDVNPLGAQFLLVTHNDSLLDSNWLRRDQIVLLGQNRDGATEWYAISDLDRKPKPDESFQRRYLNGGYGGVPRIGDLRSIFAEMVDQFIKPKVGSAS